MGKGVLRKKGWSCWTSECISSESFIIGWYCRHWDCILGTEVRTRRRRRRRRSSFRHLSSSCFEFTAVEHGFPRSLLTHRIKWICQVPAHAHKYLMFLSWDLYHWVPAATVERLVWSMGIYRDGLKGERREASLRCTRWGYTSHEIDNKRLPLGARLLPEANGAVVRKS